MSLITSLFAEMLKFFYGCTGDWGIAIVCLTLLAKFCLLPLQIYQRKSMTDAQASPSGCLVLLLQLPIMICLYRSISVGLTVQAGTKLFPWIKSLLVRDVYGILPLMSVAVQVIPQLYPYIVYFERLELSKPVPGMILTSVVMTALVCFPLPSGVGIYYLVSGLFSAADQAVWNMCRVRRLRGRQAA